MADFEGLDAELQALIKRLSRVIDGIYLWFTADADTPVNNGLTDLPSLAALIAFVNDTANPALTGETLTAGAADADIPETTSETLNAVAQALLDKATAINAALTALSATRGATNGLAPLDGDQLVPVANIPQAAILALRNIANGLAPLDADGKLPVGNLPASVVGALKYIGTWNASIGTAPSGSPAQGNAWRVSTAGATNLSDITDWKVGDWAVYNGSAWDKFDNTDQVLSVFGRMGAIVAALGDYSANLITYDHSTSGLSATQIQSALDEIVMMIHAATVTISKRLDADSVVAGTTLTDTNLSFPIAANETWNFEINLSVFCSSGGDCRPAINAPAGATLTVSGFGGDTSSNTLTMATGSTPGGDIAVWSMNNRAGQIFLKGSVKNGATAGNVTLAHHTALTKTTTVYAGSSLTAHRGANV